MTKVKRQFDRSKYLNNPRAMTPAEEARLEAARDRWLRMSPQAFWLRAAGGLAVSVLACAALGWLFDWPLLRTVVWIGVATIAAVAGNLFAFRRYTRGRRSLQ